MVEKVLEFLYQADYTIPRTVVASDFRGFKKTLQAQARGKQQEEIAEYVQSEESEQEPYENSCEQVEDDLVDVSSEETEENILGEDDTFITSCHPCYFHARMYGEGDYFQITDLKAKAKSHFAKTFMDNPDAESFSKTIEEIYSDRAVYVDLKVLATQLIVHNLKTLWTGANPVLNRDLMKSVPEFTSDLLPSILDMCMVKNVFSQPIDQKSGEVKKRTEVLIKRA